MIKTIKEKSISLVFNGFALYIMAALILAALVFYIYFVNMTVRTLVLVQNTKSDTKALSVRVSDMETKRLNAQNGMNSEKAKSLGFVDAKEPIFVIKNSKSLSLSLKSN